MDEKKDLTDARLIELSLRKPEFFGLLMERYQDPLLRYIRRIGQLSLEDGEDLLQEVFIKIYRKLNEYDERLKFSSWAYRIAHNQAVDHFRRINCRPVSGVLEEGEWEKLISASVSLEKEIINRDCLKKIQECLAELPLKYREILILRFIEEKEYEEIMDILKKPKGSVATLIARGKEKLREKMKEKGVNCF